MGGAFRALIVDGDGFARSADHGAVRAESLGDGIAQAEDAALEASALIPGDELLVAGNAESIRRRRVEVVGAHQVEVDHRGEGVQRVSSRPGPRSRGRWRSASRAI